MGKKYFSCQIHAISNPALVETDHTADRITLDSNYLHNLQCITNETSGKPSLNESTIYTREYEDVYKKLRILMKGITLTNRMDRL